MVLNYIWIAFFIVAFVVALAKLVFWGDTTVFSSMMDATFSSSKTALCFISQHPFNFFCLIIYQIRQLHLFSSKTISQIKSSPKIRHLLIDYN